MLAPLLDVFYFVFSELSRAVAAPTIGIIYLVTIGLGVYRFTVLKAQKVYRFTVHGVYRFTVENLLRRQGFPQQAG